MSVSNNAQASQLFLQWSRFDEQISRLNWRQLILIQGDSTWIDTIFSQYSLLNRNTDLAFIASNASWQGEQANAACLPSSISKLAKTIHQQDVFKVLGSTFGDLIFDARLGFDVNAFAASVGLVQGGSYCFLLLPEQWQSREYIDHSLSKLASYSEKSLGPLTNHFFPWWIQHLLQSSTTIHCFQQASITSVNQQIKSRIAELPKKESTKESKEKSKEKLKKETNISEALDSQSVEPNQDQQTAIDAIIRCAKGHARRPVIVHAPRGRGKSAALGMAIAQLDAQYKVLVAANSQQQITCLQQFYELYSSKLQHKNRSWQFYTIEQLVNTLPEADVLVIDEAATVNLDDMKIITEQYNRLTLATTTQGYEGTAQAFRLKLLPMLEKIYRQIKIVELKHPIRWSEGDPVERLVDDSLMLGTQSLTRHAVDNRKHSNQENFSQTIKPRNLTFEYLSKEALLKDALLNDEGCLREVYELLVSSHYKNTPLDLRQLLDVNANHCFVMKHEDTIVAAALLQVEGEISEQLAEEFLNQPRRLKGHLLMQGAINHGSDIRFATAKSVRVLRIAVANPHQSAGVGTIFLKHLRAYVENHMQVAYWGVSFGVQSRLLKFWLDNNFNVFELSAKRSANSGEYHCMCIQAIDKDFEAPIGLLTQAFKQNLLVLIQRDTNYDTEVLIQLFQSSAKHQGLVENRESRSFQNAIAIKQVERYINQSLSFEQSIASLTQYAQYCLQHRADDMSAQDIDLLITLFVKHQPLRAGLKITKDANALTQLNNYLRQLLGRILESTGIN